MPTTLQPGAAKPGQPAQKKDQQSSEQLMDELEKLSHELEALRTAYEQYFLGMERRPPTQRHDKLKRAVVSLQTTTVKQTAVKFRAQSLNAKLVTYERMWSRTMQEIEDGVYKRDLFKARLHRQEREEKERAKAAEAAQPPQPPPPPPDAVKPSAPPAQPVPSAPGARPSVPPVPPGATPPGPKPSGPPSARPSGPPARPSAPVASATAGQLSDAKVKAIFEAYVSAKRRCNEDTSKLTLDSVAVTLRQQVPVLMKQHNAKTVEFKVVIKDGKAVLRALPKNEP